MLTTNPPKNDKALKDYWQTILPLKKKKGALI